MEKRAGLWLWSLVALIACLQSAACVGTPVAFHSVALSPSTPQVIGQGPTHTLSIMASVRNDSSGAGVTWAPPAHGTLTGATTTSVTYVAPTVAAGQSVSDSVKATSVTYPSQSASLAITVEGAPLITTTSLPSGNWGSQYSATINETGGVPPFSWSIVAGSLTPNLTLGSSTSSSVTISGIPQSQTNSSFTIQVADSAGQTGTAGLSITIGPPLPLQVTTASLPNGALNSPYPATTLQATGGVPPYSWTLTTAPSSFPPGLTLASSGSISGTPTQLGTFNFTVQVADSIGTTPATASLSITISNLAQLSGNYAFEFSGFNSSGDAIVVAGSFTADGKGNLTSILEDLNSVGGTPQSPAATTGTYTVGAGNIGTLNFSGLPGKPSYSFVNDATGSYGRMIETDSSGTRGSGQIEKRTVSTCAANTINGNWVFGITGQHINQTGLAPAGPTVVVGSFLATPSGTVGTAGSISSGEEDSNWPGGVTISSGSQGDLSLSGTFNTTSQSTRCSMSLSFTLGAMNFDVYPVTASEAFLVETDTVSATSTPAEPFLMAGKMLAQVGAPFVGLTGSTFTATSVAGMLGQYPTNGSYVPDVALISLAGTGSSAYTISILENRAGTITPYAPIGMTFTLQDQYGRVNSGITTPMALILYIVNNNEAFAIGETLSNSGIPIPQFGLLEPQSTGPFSASTIAGLFAQGTAPPATSPVQDLVGSYTLAGSSSTAGTITGTQEQSTSGGSTSGSVTGTYSLTSTGSTDGSGTYVLTAPSSSNAAFYIVSPTKLVGISTTSGDADPVLLFLGNCASTCGED